MTEAEWKMIRRSLFATARKRARAKGRDFTIKVEDIEWPKDGLCPILQVPLKKHRGKIEPNTPTLDRINQEKGYIPGNVKVISWTANYVKAELTPNQIERMWLYVNGKLG